MLDEIPPEILANIFVRLPFENLIGLKCVSKSWRHLIESSYFGREQSKKSRLIQTYPHPDFKVIVLGGKYLDKQLYAFDSVVPNGEGLCRANAKQLSSPTTKFPGHLVQILGSCNGIVCLIIRSFRRDHNLVLWNPFTCSYFNIPSPPEDFSSYLYDTSEAFGYDHINDDYKVVKWFRSGTIARRYEICVYSLKHKSWATKKNGIPFDMREQYGHYFLPEDCSMVNGSAHWYGYTIPPEDILIIVAFDLATYEFRKISCSLFLERSGAMKLICFSGCLSIVHYRNCYPFGSPFGGMVAGRPKFADIYVLGKCGVELSCKKLASIELPEDGKINEVMPLAILENERKLLLKVRGGKIGVYDIQRKALCKVAIKGETDGLCVCGKEDCLGADFCYSATYCVCVGSFANPACYSKVSKESCL